MTKSLNPFETMPATGTDDSRTICSNFPACFLMYGIYESSLHITSLLRSISPKRVKYVKQTQFSSAQDHITCSPYTTHFNHYPYTHNFFNITSLIFLTKNSTDEASW